MSETTEFDNVVLIVVDALRYDKLGVNGSNLNTPNIDAFAEEYTNFDDAFACSNVTDVCVSTIMSGEYPLEHGVLHQGSNVTEQEKQYAEGTTFLAEHLSEEGFETVAIEPVLERWHRNGFDTYLPERDEEKNGTTLNHFLDMIRSTGGTVLNTLPNSLSERIYPVIKELSNPPIYRYNAEEITDMGLNLFDEYGKNTFYFFHYWDTHTPYDVQGKNKDEIASQNAYDTTNINEKISELGIEGSITDEGIERKIRQGKPETIADISSWYDFSVEYVDKWIGELLDGLKKRGMFENSLVILTSDHGESLTEHGILYDHHGLYDETIHVPLIIGGGGIKSHDVQGLVQHYDIAPTILDALGIEQESMLGGSLLKTDLGEGNPPYEYVFAEEHHTQENRAVRTDNYKLIQAIGNQTCRYCDTKHSSGDQLYDIETDPDEEENLLLNPSCEDYYAIQERLSTAFSQWQEQLSDPNSGSQRASYSEDQLEDRLDALGYK